MKKIMPIDKSREEIFNQPEVFRKMLEECIDNINDLSRIFFQRNLKKIFLLGSGDSFYIGLCAKLAFEEYAGITLNVIQAYEYASFGDIGIDKESAVVAISSSGRISTTRDALVRAKMSGAFIIGITNKTFDENPFICEADFSIIPRATKDGWPTQTSLTALGVLIALSIYIGKRKGKTSNESFNSLIGELKIIPEKILSVLECCQNEIRKLEHIINKVNRIIFIGSGPGFGVANIGTALMAEGPGIICPCFFIEEFFHALRGYSVGPGDLFFLIASDDSSLQRYHDLIKIVKNSGAYLITIFCGSDEALEKSSNLVLNLDLTPVPFSPLLSMVMLHRITLFMTEDAIKRGYREPDFDLVNG